MGEAIVFITYSEVFGRRPSRDEIDEQLASLNRADAFKVLARMNNFLALFPAIESDREHAQLQNILYSHYISPHLRAAIGPALREVNPISRPLFHRPGILLLMKRVLAKSLPGDEGLRPGSDDEAARFLLGEVCFKASDLVQTDVQEDTLFQNEAAHDRVMQELLVQLLPTFELMNPPEFAYALVRTHRFLEIYQQIATEKFGNMPLFDFVEEKVGISLNELLALILGAYSSTLHPLESLMNSPNLLNISKGGFFSQLDYPDNKFSAFFALLVRSVDELASLLGSTGDDDGHRQQYDFTLFRRFPYFELSADVVSAVDITFVIEKVSFGLYHTILNLLRDMGENPGRFQPRWGLMFEQYVTELLERVYLNNERQSSFLPTVKFDLKKEDVEGFDGLIQAGSSLVVYETKAGLITVKARYGGDSVELLSDLDSRFGRKSNRSASKQLAIKLEHLFHRDKKQRRSLRGVDTKSTTNVYPILIANDHCLRFGLVHWLLRRWFSEEISERLIDANVKIHSLMVLTAEDLEKLSPYLEAGDFTLVDFARFYSKLKYQRGAWFSRSLHWYEPTSSFSEVLYRFREARGTPFRRVESMDDRWGQLCEAFISRFRPDGGGIT